jgi:excisionase family DNA binding protein
MKSLSTADRLLTPIEAAQLLGIKAETLATWRVNRRYGIPFVKVGTHVRYWLSDLERWLASRTVSAVER